MGYCNNCGKRCNLWATNEEEEGFIDVSEGKTLCRKCFLEKYPQPKIR